MTRRQVAWLGVAFEALFASWVIYEVTACAVRGSPLPLWMALLVWSLPVSAWMLAYDVRELQGGAR